MWTSAPNLAHPDNFEAAPNSLLDPVVMGLPGTLPVLNKRALDMSILLGLALNCQISERSSWDRKSYWYPDLPKSYQISQLEAPVCGPGYLDLPSGKRIRINHAHLEEDAGKLLHEAPGGIAVEGTLVDLNRAGTPLLELVTEPDFDCAEDVVAFGRELRLIARHLGVTAGVMQMGHMRFEPNINVRIEKDGKTYATPIVEIKNLNSYKAVEGAIRYEHQRQVEQWLKDGRVFGPRTKSTHGWDDVRMVTVLQREKEDADEYRYFPDPDLVEVEIGAAWVNSLESTLPELPRVRQQRWLDEWSLSEEDAEALIEEPALSNYFESVVNAGASGHEAAKFLRNAAAKLANSRQVDIDQLGVTAEQIAAVLSLVTNGKIASNQADKLLAACCDKQAADPAQLAAALGFLQLSDESVLLEWVQQVLADPTSAKAIEQVRAGNSKAAGALMGKVAKLSAGKANMGRVNALLLENIDKIES